MPLTQANYARRPVESRRALRIGLLAAASGVVGLLVLSLSNRLASEDRVAVLAEVIGLKTGLLLGAALAALVGGWLAHGGARRIAGFAGVVLAGLIWVAILLIFRPHAWVLDAVLEGILGEDGAAYSPAVLAFILILSWRALKRGLAGLVYGLVARQVSPRGIGSSDQGASLRSASGDE
jgi:hypothetical protein